MKLESWDEDIWRTRDRSIDRPVLRPDTGQKLDVNRRLLGRSHTTYSDASVLQRAQAARMPQQVLNQLLFQHLGARKRAFVEVALDRCECRTAAGGWHPSETVRDSSTDASRAGAHPSTPQGCC